MQLTNGCGDCFALDNGRLPGGLPLHEFREMLGRSRRDEMPGPPAELMHRRTDLVPQLDVLEIIVVRNATSRDEQIALQRISQMIPMIMVPTPVSWPTARPNFSATRVARLATYPANRA
jgi:hypothetical protein